MESEGVRLRVYVNKRKELILAPDYFEKYGGVSNETIQIKEGEFTAEIEKRSQRSYARNYQPLAT